jgi:hypothetical protein
MILLPPKQSPTVLTMYTLDNVPKTTSNLPKALLLVADGVRKGSIGGTLGPTSNDIVISRAFAKAVFTAHRMIKSRVSEIYQLKALTHCGLQGGLKIPLLKSKQRTGPLAPLFRRGGMGRIHAPNALGAYPLTRLIFFLFLLVMCAIISKWTATR